jgi:mediator of RNA polymerase II transcription subunit 12
MSTAMFSSVRAILEAVEDFTMLADVLGACSKASNPEILASCADTINLNLQIFLATGTAEDLFETLIDRLKTSSRDHGVVARPLLAALSNLADRMPGREEMAKQLLQELLQNDRSSAIDACSPVSDSMMLQMQGSEGEVSEEIDKLMTSGNSIDPPTMNRLFRNIVPRLEAGWAKNDDSLRVFALLLTRLRIFDMQHFDKLISDWISHIRSLNQRSSLAELFPLLLSLGCLPIAKLLQTANAAPPKLESLRPNHASSVYLQELLRLLLTKLPASTSKTLGQEELYRFRIQQRAAKSEHCKALLMLIRNAILEYAGLRQQVSNEETLPFDEPDCQEQVCETIGALVVADFNAVADALAIKNLPPQATDLVRKIISKLLCPSGAGPSETSFDQILGSANELTMPLCQLKLNLELSVGESTSAQDDPQGQQSRFEVFAKAMDRAIEARSIMWTGMLPCLSDDITQHLKNQAYARFLDLIPSSKSASFDDDASDSGRIQLAQNLLGVLESIISGQSATKPAHLTAALAEKLSNLWEIMSAKEEGKDVKATVKEAVLDHWLPLLIRFTTLHTALPDVPAIPPSSISSTSKIVTPVNINIEARAKTATTLCSVLLGLESLPQKTTGVLVQQIFDVAAMLIDGLPEDVRLQCAKSILLMSGSMPSTSTSSDPRLYYLFSSPQPSKADNLVLSHRERAAMPHSAAARGMGAMYGIGPASQEKMSPFVLRRWEILSEPTPNVGENDTSLNLRLFEAIKLQ